MRDVVAGVGLGDGECYMHLAADDPGQVAELLLLAAVEDERADAEDRKMDRTGRRHRTASGGDFAHHEGGLGDSKSAAAVALRDRDAEVAGSGDGGEEVVGKFGAAIVLAPVLIGEVGAQRAHLPDDLVLCFGQFEVHISTRLTMKCLRCFGEMSWLKRS